MANIIIEKHGHITVIKINRIEKKNAVDHNTSMELEAAFNEFNTDINQHIAILTGNGDTFCAGADLNDVVKMSDDAMNKNGPMGFTRMYISKPVIAAISGYCVAGGLEMALAADIRVADKDSSFGFLERRFGVPLIDGGTQRLPRIIGFGRAMDMILTGKLIDAGEAYRIGLVNYLAEHGGALDFALGLARQIDSFPQITMNNDREAAYTGIDHDLKYGLAIEAVYGRETLQSGTAIKGADEFLSGKGRHGKNI
ncbi:MAG: crotonase/enoyl-CoA hydratase family protein [Ferroplasma sp.]